jgi:hypothetical protein
MPVTTTELLIAGFTELEIASAKGARRVILNHGTKEDLIQKAVRAAQRQNFDKDKLRGVYYILCRTFHPKQSISINCPEIADAVDPSWQLLPSPSELQDDFSCDEIAGHLALLNFSFECYHKVFSSNKQYESHFLLFTTPSSHNSGSEKWNWGKNDLALFSAYSAFTNSKGTLNNGPATDRFGLFVTKTKGWVGESTWWKAPFHGWVAWLSRRHNKRFQLLIFEPNYIPTPGATVHKSDILPAQRAFIQHCLKAWKTLDDDFLFLIWNTAGNPEGKCLQLCSQWLQTP